MTVEDRAPDSISKPTGQTDPTMPQAEMLASAAPPAPPVKRIFEDLLHSATDGSVAWERLRDGIDIARLFQAPDGGPCAALLRYAPGAKLPRHEHVGFEQIYVLAGSQTDDSGEHHAGALLIHGPGTYHTIVSKHGCLVLAFWEKPVRF